MRLAIRAGVVVFMAILTAAAAQVSVPLPFTPVPLTLQPMVVLLCGAVLGSRLGTLAQVAYISAGLAGAPVFAASPLLFPGPARLLGPTGGFLMVYPLAAFLTGWLAERGFARRFATAVGTLAAGLAVIFTGGAAWLAWGQPHGLGLDAALRLGVYPFLLFDLLKLGIAATVLPALWRWAGRNPEPGA